MWRFGWMAGLAVALWCSGAHAQQWQKIDCGASKVSIDGMKTCSRGPDDVGAIVGCHTEQYSAAYGWTSAQQAATVFAYVVDRSNSSCYTTVYADNQLDDILKKVVQNSGKVESKNFSPMQVLGGAHGMRVDWPARKCFVFHLNGPPALGAGAGGGSGFANYVRGFVCGPTSGAPLGDDEIVKFLSSVHVKQ